MPTQLSFDFDDWQPCERLDERIRPNQYRLYRTGGLHPFFGAKGTLPRYQQAIWPYIKRLHYEPKRDAASQWRLNKGPADQMKLYLRVGGHMYPSISLEAVGDRLYKNVKTAPNSLYCMMHRLVAMAFLQRVPGKDHVMHLNDDPTNYLPENLKWGTNSENHSGIKVNTDTIDDKYALFEKRGLLKG